MDYVDLKLPNGFMHEGKLVKEVSLAALMPDDMDYLRSKKEQANPGLLFRVLRRCITDMGGSSDPVMLDAMYEKVHLPDALFLLKELRQLSVADKYRFEYLCDCGKLSPQSIMLSGIPIDDQPEAFVGMDPIVRSVGVFEEGDFSSRMIKFRPLVIEDHLELDSIRTEHPDKQATLGCLVQLQTLDGVVVTPSTLKDRKVFSWKLLLAINSAMEKSMGGADFEIDRRCKSCERITKGTLPVGTVDFFFRVTASIDTYVPEAQPSRKRFPSTGTTAKSSLTADPGLTPPG